MKEKDTSIRELFHQPPTETLTDVSVSGWVRTVRDSKAFGFIELNDGTYFKNLQIVLEDGKTADFANALKVTLGSAIRAKGDLVPTPGMKQPFELKAKEIEVVGLCSPDYPLQKKRHSFEYLRTIAHLRPRTNTFYAVFRIRSLAAQLLHAFFAERGFVYVHTPLITTSDCEGAGEMFQVTTLPLENVPKTESGEVDYSQDFFCKPANLTVSGQLNVETFCQAFRNVYTFGPTFRAEKSNTPRHAAEFWMVEPEIAFADLFDDMVAGRGHAQVRHHPHSGRSARGNGLPGQLCGKGTDRQADRHCRKRFRPLHLHRGHRHSAKERPEVRIPRQLGHRPAD